MCEFTQQKHMLVASCLIVCVCLSASVFLSDNFDLTSTSEDKEAKFVEYNLLPTPISFLIIHTGSISSKKSYKYWKVLKRNLCSLQPGHILVLQRSNRRLFVHRLDSIEDSCQRSHNG